MTTHSPVALRELSGNQLFVMRGSTERHEVRVVGTADDTQSTIRLYPDAFLAPNVLVCEGAPRSSASCAACYSDQQRKTAADNENPDAGGSVGGDRWGWGSAVTRSTVRWPLRIQLATYRRVPAVVHDAPHQRPPMSDGAASELGGHLRGGDGLRLSGCVFSRRVLGGTPGRLGL